MADDTTSVDEAKGSNLTFKSKDAPVIETLNTGVVRIMNLTKSEMHIPLTNGAPALKVGIGRYNTSDEVEKKVLPQDHMKMLLHQKMIKYV
jgi:hypothetical protein